MSEAELLAAVVAAPDDDTPRLVYADSLQERGGPKDGPRGELIVVQCERARLEREEKTTTLEYRQACWREKSLLARVDGYFRRGFPHRVSLPTPTVEAIRSLPKAAAAPLLETIELQGHGRLTFDAQKFLALIPELPPDARLWIAERGLPHERLVPALIGARFGVATERTILDLVENEAPNLRAVGALSSLRFTNGALRRYATTASYARLEQLDLWRLTDDELRFFLTNAPPAKMLALQADEDVPQQRNASFQGCRALAHVRELNVAVAYDLEQLVLVLRDAVNLERWTAPNGMTAEACEAVARGPLTKRLRHLEVSFTQRGPDVMNILTAPWERLTSLAIGNAAVGLELATASALDTLVELRLFGCELSGDVENAIRARWPHARIE